MPSFGILKDTMNDLHHCDLFDHEMRFQEKEESKNVLSMKCEMLEITLQQRLLDTMQSLAFRSLVN